MITFNELNTIRETMVVSIYVYAANQTQDKLDIARQDIFTYVSALRRYYINNPLPELRLYFSTKNKVTEAKVRSIYKAFCGCDMDDVLGTILSPHVLTEDGNMRVTEDGQLRLLEEG